ncbi:PQQ-binding-like beta-propeller repeat protein [Terriglobus roseus]|nr:PQQ-binding-like beta-propeller repeat protein [Terriglobus roseus]
MRRQTQVPELLLPVTRLRTSSRCEDIVQPPLLQDDRVFLIARDGTLTAYDADLKDKLWSRASDVGWGTSQLWQGHLLTMPSPGLLSVVDLRNGEEVERQEVGELTLNYSAIVGDLVLTPLEYPKLGAWNLFKKELVWTAPSEWELSYLTADESVVVVSEESECVGLTVGEGTELWRYSVAEVGRHTLALHGERPGATLGHAVLGNGIAFLPVTGGLLLALNTTDGSLRWQYRAQTASVRNFALAPDREELYLLTENRLTVLHPTSGNVLRDYALQGLQHPAGDGPYSPISLSQDAVWTVDGGGMLTAISRENARVLQRAACGTPVYEPMTLGRDRIYLLNALGGVTVVGHRS